MVWKSHYTVVKDTYYWSNIDLLLRHTCGLEKPLQEVPVESKERLLSQCTAAHVSWQLAGDAPVLRVHATVSGTSKLSVSRARALSLSGTCTMAWLLWQLFQGPARLIHTQKNMKTKHTHTHTHTHTTRHLVQSEGRVCVWRGDQGKYAEARRR